jgi:sugar O-acyltransferase (sialic acid O-acetyltransferase NeuD family)
MNSEKKPVIILGAGGHAKVIMDILSQKKIKILGMAALHNSKKANYDFKTFSDEEVIANFDSEEINLVNGLGSLPNDNKRYELSKKYLDFGFKFINIIHTSSIISKNTKILDGAQIMAGVIIGPGCKIGEGTIVNSQSSIDHDCEIENYSHICPGVVCSGNVRIGSFVHISTGVSIINNINIGDNSIIYPGVTLVKDVPKNSIVRSSVTNIRKDKSK